MEDDIDIEEHDVLDNPAIKNIFPDLSIIKKEISLFEDEAFAVKSEKDTASKISSNSTSEESNCELCINLNEVSYVSDRTSREPSQSSADEKPIFKNRIILGSRPAQKSIHPKIHYEDKVYSAKVCVSDIRPYLTNSKKFCTVCNIFFPQIIDLETHDKLVHEKNVHDIINVSNPVQPAKIVKYKCEKCSSYFDTPVSLTRHLKNIHNKKHLKIRRPKLNRTLKQNALKSNADKSKSLGTTRCFHCKRLFPSQKSLINHIYNILQSTTINQQTQQQLIESKKKIKETYNTRRNILEKRKNEQINQPQAQIRTISAQDSKIYVFRCYYCSYYLKDLVGYRSHLSYKHRDFAPILTKKVMFNPYCKFCDAKQGNIHKYNCHLHFRHTDMLHKTFKIQPKIFLTKVELILAIRQIDTNNQKIKSSSYNQFEENSHSFDDYEDNISETNSDKVVEEPDRKRKETEKSVVPTYGTRTAKVAEERKRKRNVNSVKLRNSIVSRKKIKIEQNVITTTDVECEGNEDLVLKGILFRCKRCDIHFLTSRYAMDHSEHMEMLINWKCQICLKIFKKQDEYLHSQQHSYSDEFVVYELSESKLSRVLYKCPKCAIHFNDIKYAYHFMNCGQILTESSYCNACDILLEKSVRSSHDYEHQNNNKSLADFTIVTSDIILSPKCSNKIIGTKKKDNKRIREEDEIKNEDILNSFSFCDTCKCFIINAHLRSVHKEGRCHHMVKYVCKYCGLILTNKSINSHRRRHREEKDLKLQDFKFYNLKNNKQILPPIPDYPKCDSCDVRFISKVAVANHVCKENEFLTCPICDIKLSDEAFKLHLSFHNYSMKNSKNSVLSKSLLNESKSTKKEVESSHLSEVDNVYNDNAKSSDDLENNMKQLAKIDHENQITQRQQAKIMEPEKITSQIISQSETFTAKDSNREEALPSPLMDEKTDLELCNVIYCCSHCYITFINFDQAVKHCQDHYCDIDMSKGIVTCTECKMKYERKDCNDHTKIHDLQKLNSLRILNFDTAYFAVDYKLWIQNLFESIEPHTVQAIINRSIYKYEGRIKLTVIQKGITDITLYKCKTCRMFVDPDAILSHTENSCYKLRKHICSFCGIPFVSHVFRMSHEQVHKNKNELSVNSFRIVIFNRDKDKVYNMNVINSRSNFILFQCRQCKGIFERFQNLHHQCNKCDLKKCPICGLLIRNADHKPHVMKHANVSNFTQNHMKIIRFGKSDNSKPESSGLPFMFAGVVKDYTFYKCPRCNVFIKKTKHLKTEHDCFDINAKVECSLCNLHFLKKHIIQHNKMHDKDPYCVKENFNILLLKDPDVESSDKLQTGAKVNQGIEIEENISLVKLTDEKRQSPTKEKALVNDAPVVVRVAKIYKCDCRLCFLDKESITSHFGHCKSKIIRQTCTKCSLLFSPKSLFNHLLKHHGDKKYLYKFIIIRMNKIKNKIIELYNCSICNLHFVEREKAKEHFDNNCANSVSEENKCEHCQLYFDIESIEFHKNYHHGENVADYDIIDINEESNNRNEFTSMDKNIENIASQADAVIDKTYRVSEDSLAQISLNSYTNTIYKCLECKIHYLTENTFHNHLRKTDRNGHVKFSSPQKDCEHCGLNFSLASLPKHIYVHHNQMKLELSQINIKSSIFDNVNKD